MSDTPPPDDAIAAWDAASATWTPQEYQTAGDALRARLSQAEQERDAAETARDEVFAVLERQHVQPSDQRVNEELNAARAEVVALRTALETINVGTNDKWVLAIARAALGSSEPQAAALSHRPDKGRDDSTNEPSPTDRNRYHAALFYLLAHPEDAKRIAREALFPLGSTNEPEETQTDDEYHHAHLDDRIAPDPTCPICVEREAQ